MIKTNNSTNTHKNLIKLVSYFLFTFLTLSLMSCSNGVKTKEASNYNADLGIRYLQKGRLKLANEKLMKAIKQNPRSAKSNHYFALLQKKLGDDTKANQYFLKAIRLSPKDSELRNNYGSFLCENGKASKAVKQFLLAVKDPLYSTPEFAYTNAGVCLSKVHNNREAEKYLRLALKKEKNFPAALLEMAKLFYDRKNYPKAQAFMLRYETVGKSTPKALQLCTTINVKMGDTSKADTCKSTLLRLFPESKEAEQINESL